MHCGLLSSELKDVSVSPLAHNLFVYGTQYLSPIKSNPSSYCMKMDIGERRAIFTYDNDHVLFQPCASPDASPDRQNSCSVKPAHAALKYGLGQL
jgi:hypothetical protein